MLDHLDLVFYRTNVRVKLVLEPFKAILFIALCCQRSLAIEQEGWFP